MRKISKKIALIVDFLLVLCMVTMGYSSVNKISAETENTSVENEIPGLATEDVTPEESSAEDGVTEYVFSEHLCYLSGGCS